MNKQTAHLLEQHFDTAFSAPNGIQKLRELILTLAMQGRLVPQDPNDPPARELLKDIEAEKKRLAKDGKIKASKLLPEITSSDAPYALPQGWQWVRLGSVGNVFNGNSINASEKEAKYAGAKGLPYIATKDVGYGFDPVDYENGICIPVGEDKFRVAHEGAVLICAEGGSAGKKCGLTDRDICFGNKLFANELYGQIPSRFILYAYLSPVFRASFAAAMTGIIGGVSIAKFVEIPIPLPPLEEQHRIDAKIDQLMARCDALENLRNEREEKRLSTHAAALSQLLDTTGNGSADDTWAFITQHFGELYAVKENVAELRKAILQLAVMGKLVPQDPNDAPASELLKDIDAEKKRLVKENKIKAPKPLPEIKPEEVPYALPKGWEWVHFESIVDIGSGITKGRNLSGRKIVTVPYLRVANVQRGFLDLTEIKEIEIPVSEIEKLQLANGDLLITEGGDWDKVGRTSIWRSEIPLCAHQNHIFKARKVIEIQSEIWLEKYLNSPNARTYFAGAAKQTTNLASINKTQLRRCPIPIPPLKEQHRIVTKINQLMSLCDSLEQRIAAATRKQTELLNAVMAQV